MGMEIGLFYQSHATVFQQHRGGYQTCFGDIFKGGKALLDSKVLIFFSVSSETL